MNTRTRTLTTAFAAAFVTAAVVIAGMVFSQGSTDALDTQLATAIQHAEFAVNAEDHAMAVRHLGHVLNCIAGEGGEGFDAAWGHPCADQGDGIMGDVAAHAHAADVGPLVNAAHALAMDGVQQESLGAVHASAAGVRALLMALRDFGG
jgi:hypothetical protein